MKLLKGQKMSKIEERRAAGNMTLAAEEHLVRLDHDLLKDACPATRRIIAPIAAEQVRHYEAAKARA